MEKYEISVKNTKIDVLYEFDKQLPVVQFKLIFKNVGSLNEKIEGLGKLTSNLLKEGTKTLGGSEFARLLDINDASSPPARSAGKLRRRQMQPMRRAIQRNS